VSISLALLHLQAREMPLCIVCCRLENADVVFKCLAIKHAGLSFNRITALPQPIDVSSSQLMLLDVSYNYLCDLPNTLTVLKSLPHLLSLDLAGNPFCLLQGYHHAVRAALPQLRYCDGKVRISSSYSVSTGLTVSP
jgi:hypothetical protein